MLTILTRKKPSSKRDPTLYRALLLNIHVWYISEFRVLRLSLNWSLVISQSQWIIKENRCLGEVLYYLNALFNFPVPIFFLLHSCQFKPNFILNLLLIRLNLNVHVPESRKIDLSQALLQFNKLSFNISYFLSHVNL